MKKVTEINRRDFFKNAALAGAGLVLSSGTVLASGEDKTAFIQSPNSNLSTLPTRKLGPLEVTGIGLGCMSMVAGTYNPTPPKDEMIAHLRKAVERGRPFPCRFFRL